jgi:hypothetical protein
MFKEQVLMMQLVFAALPVIMLLLEVLCVSNVLSDGIPAMVAL